MAGKQTLKKYKKIINQEKEYIYKHKTTYVDASFSGMIYKNDLCGTVITTMNHDNNFLIEVNMENLRIRKLTPKERFRLQGVKDKDIDLVMKHQSNALGYHLAGDSICVPVLMALYSELLGIDWKKHFVAEEWWNNETI